MPAKIAPSSHTWTDHMHSVVSPSMALAIRAYCYDREISISQFVRYALHDKLYDYSPDLAMAVRADEQNGGVQPWVQERCKEICDEADKWRAACLAGDELPF